MAYDKGVHIKVSKSTPNIIKDSKTLQLIGSGENIVELQHKFAVQVMNGIDSDIVTAVINEAKAAGINDVFLLDHDFVINALLVASKVKGKSFSYSEENNEIKELKDKLAKARGGCQRLKEENEMLKKNNTDNRSFGYRICRVNGRDALFHGWFSEYSSTFGLVEFDNGSMKKVAPSDIRFCDNECLTQWEGRE